MKLRIVRYLDLAVEHAIYLTIFFIPISITMLGTFAGMATVFFLIKKILLPEFSSIKANKLLLIFLVMFFVFMGLSLFNSGPLLGKSLKALFVKWLRYPLLLWAVIETFQDTRRVVKAACVLLFSATLVGLTVFTQKFFGFEFLRGNISGGFSVPSVGPFRNQNALAAYLTCVIPVVLSLGLWFGFGFRKSNHGFAARWKRVVIKLSFLLIIVMLIGASYWTVCRGGWLGLIAGLAFLILIINYHRIKKVFWPIFLTWYLFFVPAIGICLFYYQNRRDSYRFIIFNWAWGMIKDHPLLGNGVGTFMDRYSFFANTTTPYYAHNCYLQILAESGIFSLLFFLLFVGYILYRSIKTSLRISSSLNYFILIGLTAGLLGFLIHSFFEVHLYSFQLGFLFWVILGLVVALINFNESESVK